MATVQMESARGRPDDEEREYAITSWAAYESQMDQVKSMLKSLSTDLKSLHQGGELCKTQVLNKIGQCEHTLLQINKLKQVRTELLHISRGHGVRELNPASLASRGYSFAGDSVSLEQRALETKWSETLPKSEVSLQCPYDISYVLNDSVMTLDSLWRSMKEAAYVLMNGNGVDEGGNPSLDTANTSIDMLYLRLWRMQLVDAEWLLKLGFERIRRCEQQLKHTQLEIMHSIRDRDLPRFQKLVRFIVLLTLNARGSCTLRLRQVEPFCIFDANSEIDASFFKKHITYRESSLDGSRRVCDDMMSSAGDSQSPTLKIPKGCCSPQRNGILVDSVSESAEDKEVHELQTSHGHSTYTRRDVKARPFSSDTSCSVNQQCSRNVSGSTRWPAYLRPADSLTLDRHTLKPIDRPPNARTRRDDTMVRPSTGCQAPEGYSTPRAPSPSICARYCSRVLGNVLSPKEINTKKGELRNRALMLLSNGKGAKRCIVTEQNPSVFATSRCVNLRRTSREKQSTFKRDARTVSERKALRGPGNKEGHGHDGFDSLDYKEWREQQWPPGDGNVMAGGQPTNKTYHEVHETHHDIYSLESRSRCVKRNPAVSVASHGGSFQSVVFKDGTQWSTPHPRNRTTQKDTEQHDRPGIRRYKRWSLFDKKKAPSLPMERSATFYVERSMRCHGKPRKRRDSRSSKDRSDQQKEGGLVQRDDASQQSRDVFNSEGYSADFPFVERQQLHSATVAKGLVTNAQECVRNSSSIQRIAGQPCKETMDAVRDAVGESLESATWESDENNNFTGPPSKKIGEYRPKYNTCSQTVCIELTSKTNGDCHDVCSAVVREAEMVTRPTTYSLKQADQSVRGQDHHVMGKENQRAINDTVILLDSNVQVHATKHGDTSMKQGYKWTPTDVSIVEDQGSSRCPFLSLMEKERYPYAGNRTAPAVQTSETQNSGQHPQQMHTYNLVPVHESENSISNGHEPERISCTDPRRLDPISSRCGQTVTRPLGETGHVVFATIIPPSLSHTLPFHVSDWSEGHVSQNIEPKNRLPLVHDHDTASLISTKNCTGNHSFTAINVGPGGTSKKVTKKLGLFSSGLRLYGRCIQHLLRCGDAARRGVCCGVYDARFKEIAFEGDHKWTLNDPVDEDDIDSYSFFVSTDALTRERAGLFFTHACDASGSTVARMSCNASFQESHHNASRPYFNADDFHAPLSTHSTRSHTAMCSAHGTLPDSERLCTTPSFSHKDSMPRMDSFLQRESFLDHTQLSATTPSHESKGGCNKEFTCAEEPLVDNHVVLKKQLFLNKNQYPEKSAMCDHAPSSLTTGLQENKVSNGDDLLRGRQTLCSQVSYAGRSPLDFEKTCLQESRRANDDVYVPNTLPHASFCSIESRRSRNVLTATKYAFLLERNKGRKSKPHGQTHEETVHNITSDTLNSIIHEHRHMRQQALRRAGEMETHGKHVEHDPGFSILENSSDGRRNRSPHAGHST